MGYIIMNYLKLHKRLVDSLDLEQCNLKRLKLIQKVKAKAFDRPVNLSEMVQAHKGIQS